MEKHDQIEAIKSVSPIRPRYSSQIRTSSKNTVRGYITKIHTATYFSPQRKKRKMSSIGTRRSRTPSVYMQELFHAMNKKKERISEERRKKRYNRKFQIVPLSKRRERPRTSQVKNRKKNVVVEHPQNDSNEIKEEDAHPFKINNKKTISTLNDLSPNSIKKNRVESLDLSEFKKRIEKIQPLPEKWKSKAMKELYQSNRIDIIKSVTSNMEKIEQKKKEIKLAEVMKENESLRNLIRKYTGDSLENFAKLDKSTCDELYHSYLQKRIEKITGARRNSFQFMSTEESELLVRTFRTEKRWNKVKEVIRDLMRIEEEISLEEIQRIRNDHDGFAFENTPNIIVGNHCFRTPKNIESLKQGGRNGISESLDRKLEERFTPNRLKGMNSRSFVLRFRRQQTKKNLLKVL